MPQDNRTNPEKMLSRAHLEAQLGLYQKGREKLLAEIAAFNGAIEAVTNLLRVLSEMEAVPKDKLEEIKTMEVKQ